MEVFTTVSQYAIRCAFLGIRLNQVQVCKHLHSVGFVRIGWDFTGFLFDWNEFPIDNNNLVGFAT